MILNELHPLGARHVTASRERRRASYGGQCHKAFEFSIADAQTIQDAYILAGILHKGISKGASIEQMSQVYSRVRQPWGNFVVEATRLQGRLYEFCNPAFANIKEGDEVPLEILEDLGNKIQAGWRWTWKSSSQVPLQEGLAKL